LLDPLRTDSACFAAHGECKSARIHSNNKAVAFPGQAGNGKTGRMSR
jgi:hypothetical protein